MKTTEELIIDIIESSSLESALQVLSGTSMPAEVAEEQWQAIAIDMHRMAMFLSGPTAVEILERGYKEHKKHCTSNSCICSSPLMWDMANRFVKFISQQGDLLRQFIDLAAQEKAGIANSETSQPAKKKNLSIN